MITWELYGILGGYRLVWSQHLRSVLIWDEDSDIQRDPVTYQRGRASCWTRIVWPSPWNIPSATVYLQECSDCKAISQGAIIKSWYCLEFESASRPLQHLHCVSACFTTALCFYKLVVLSAWVWQQLDVPCFCPMPFLLHSHSMTSVKRASSFHENSHSTRTRSRVSRKPVILNVSRFWR